MPLCTRFTCSFCARERPAAARLGLLGCVSGEYPDCFVDVRVEHVRTEQLEAVSESEDVLDRQTRVVLLQNLHLHSAVRQHLQQVHEVFLGHEHVHLLADPQVVFEVLLRELEVQQLALFRGARRADQLLEAGTPQQPDLLLHQVEVPRVRLGELFPQRELVLRVLQDVEFSQSLACKRFVELETGQRSVGHQIEFNT